MSELSLNKDRRAQSVAAFGLVTQLLIVGLTIGVWFWSRSTAIAIAACYLAGAIPVWIGLLLVYTQRKRSRIEALETEELRREKGAGRERLFEADDEALLLERRRLTWLVRWLVPALAVLLVIYHLLVVWVWYSVVPRSITDPAWARASNPAYVVWFIGGVCFACFLLSRYASGMAHQSEWRLLRAAAAYLTGNALGCLALVIALAMSIYEVRYGEPLAAYLIGILMLIVGFEFLVNLVLDLYRPRVPGQEARPAFDSRLLGLLTEPGGIARSIAEAVNYQFGFEVSRTWFYQLLQRSVLWLVLFIAVVLWGLSGVLVVDADELAVVERFGRRVTQADKVLEPGLHLKWPWPFEIAYRAPVRRLQSIHVGDLEKGKKKEEHHENEAILWTEEHKLAAETMLLVAGPKDLSVSARSPSAGSGSEGKSVSIALLHASVVVQYRIENLLDYLYKYKEPAQVIESIVRQVLSEFAAGTELSALMGPGREQFNERITEALQAEADRLKIGVKIVFVALQDAHPPSASDVAKTFQEVVSAERRKEAAIEDAHGQAQRIKTQTAGSVTLADALNEAIREMDQLAADPKSDPEARAQARRRVDEFFVAALEGARIPIEIGTRTSDSEDGKESEPSDRRTGLAGEAAKAIAEARAEIIESVSDTASKVRVMDDERATYEASPRLYLVRKYLRTVTESVAEIRKYIVTAQAKLVVIYEEEKEKDYDFSELDKQGGG